MELGAELQQQQQRVMGEGSSWVSLQVALAASQAPHLRAHQQASSPPAAAVVREWPAQGLCWGLQQGQQLSDPPSLLVGLLFPAPLLAPSVPQGAALLRTWPCHAAQEHRGLVQTRWPSLERYNSLPLLPTNPRWRYLWKKRKGKQQKSEEWPTSSTDSLLCCCCCFLPCTACSSSLPH